MTHVQELEDVIAGVSPETLTAFFQGASGHFRPSHRDCSDDLKDDQDLLENLEELGQIEFSDGQILMVLAGKIIGDITRRRSRSAQYAVAKRVIKQNFNDAAIFVFYDDEGRFRFSLVTAFYSGKKREFSTFKRYSYFVDPTEANGTFKRQVGGCRFESLDAILQAFSIEAVSKEFYIEIAKLFTELVGGERKLGSKKQKVATDESMLKYPASDDTMRKEFAVRTLGRLVFCWFLKKKHSDNGVPLIPKEILSSQALVQTPGYYHHVLEPLFFEILNKTKELRHANYRDKAWDTIPFLNGGLFEAQLGDFYELDPITGLSAQYISILNVPDEWLARLLEVFDRYNFTIDESSPLDIEVAVDPEILGRIFENLLAEINPETGETARKSTGSFYTPREIVEYMVHESLKQYLLSCTNVPKDTIQSLLSYDYSDNPLTEEQTEIVIDRLHEIKILDPACGSGAFPMGVLQKIIFALKKLDPDGARWKDRILGVITDPTYRNALKDKLDNETWKYIHKLGVIRTCIYGVDIQPIAVEIARLRAFLSLVVDETVNDRRKNRGIEALPNLEFKFVCANTLIGLETGLGAGQKIGTMFDAANQAIEGLKQQLKTLRDDYFTCRQKDKPEIITDFTATQNQLLVYIINSGLSGKDGLKSKLALKLSGWKPFENEPSDWFNPDWMFGISDGFDIVIANPPYVEHKKLKHISAQLKEQFQCYAGTADLYVYFIEKAFEVMKPSGTLSFITSNKFIKTSYGEKIRGLLSGKNISKLIDFTEVHVFDALVASCVLIVNNCPSCPKITVAFVDDKIKKLSLEDYVSKYQKKIDRKHFGCKIWQLESNERLTIKELIENDSITLEKINSVQIFRGVTTGYNPAFIIDDAKRKELISADNKNKEIIKPILQGRNIKKWNYFFDTEYLLFVPWHFPLHKSGIKGVSLEAETAFRKSYPSVFSHLSHSKTELSERNKEETGIRYEWYALQRCAATYYEEFEKEKIIWGLTADKWAFAYDDKKHYLPSNGYILTSAGISIKYLLALLNSKMMEFYFSFEGIMTAGGAYTLKHETVAKFPIKIRPDSKQEPFIDLVDKILIAKADDPTADTSAHEEQIEQMVYELYGLTDNEIAIVEGKA